MKKIKLWENEEKMFLQEVLDFLITVYSEKGNYELGDLNDEKPIDAMILNFVKVVDDVRAILFLLYKGFYIQAGILIRSTIDACHLMMSISFEGENSTLFSEWVKKETKKQVTHFKIIEALNKRVEGNLDKKTYLQVREQLDDFVHGNFSAVRLYPAQAPGPTLLNNNTLEHIFRWKPLLRLCLFSCLLIVEQIVPKYGKKAESFRNELFDKIHF